AVAQRAARLGDDRTGHASLLASTSRTSILIRPTGFSQHFPTAGGASASSSEARRPYPPRLPSDTSGPPSSRPRFARRHCRRDRDWGSPGGGRRGLLALQPEVGLLDMAAREELRRRAVEGDPPVLEDVRAMGELERPQDVLLDEQDGRAPGR